MENRKIKYTRHVIENAFVELLQEKTLDKITVTELCKRADVNRSTFYKHYDDVYDLMEKSENIIYEHLYQNTLQNLSLSGDMGELPTQLRHNSLQLIKGNTFLWKVFLSNPDSAFIKRLTDDTIHFLETQYSDLISQVMNVPFPDTTEYNLTYQFLFHGILRIIKCWVDNGCQEPIDKIESIIGRLNKAVITTLWHD